MLNTKLSNNIIIRDALPSDSKDIANFLLAAWPVDLFLSMLPALTAESFTELISDLVSSSGNLYSWENALVAELDSKIVGAVIAYDGANFMALKKPVIDYFTKFGDIKSFEEAQETSENEYYLDSIGTDSEYRSRGIGTKLITTLIEKVRNLGYKRVGLLVDLDNPRAEALYSKLGFVYVDNNNFLRHDMRHLQIKL